MTRSIEQRLAELESEFSASDDVAVIRCQDGNEAEATRSFLATFTATMRPKLLLIVQQYNAPDASLKQGVYELVASSRG